MKASFFSYKSIDVSWFLAFAIGLIVLSSFIAKVMAREYNEHKEKIDDIFFTLLIVGFLGARLSYVLVNFDLYKENIFKIFSLSHYNLSLTGGVIVGVMALVVISKIYKIEFQKLLKIFVIPFYFSMSIGIWVILFDKLLVPFKISNNPIKILYMSMIFLLGMILEFILSKKMENKYVSSIILAVVMFLYYVI